MIAQVGGLPFLNIAAILLLPVFIFPGLAGLKFRLYVSRRTDSYGRLDTAAYSWTISTISVFILYTAIAIVQGDVNIIPQFILESESSSAIVQDEGVSVGINLFNLFLVYLAHVGICCLIGSLYGVIAFNFLDDVRVIGRATNREYMLNEVMPGKRIDVRTKSGEILRGKIPSKHQNYHDEGLLLLNPERMADNPEGYVIKQHDIGGSIYIAPEDISRISVIDSQDPDNVDPGQTINNTDRVQSFIVGLKRSLYLEETPDVSWEKGKVIAVTGGIGLIISVPSLFAAWQDFSQEGIAWLSIDISPLTHLVILFIGTPLLISTTILYISQIYSKSVLRNIAISCLVLFFAGGAFLHVNNGLDILLFYSRISLSIISGLMIGILWTYTTNWKRGYTGHVVSLFAFISIHAVDALLTGRTQLLSGLNIGFVWAGAGLLVFIVVIEGGPSRREPWSSKLQDPIVMSIAIALIALVLLWPLNSGNASFTSILAMNVPLLGAFFAVLGGYLFEQKSRYLPDQFH